jgi:uncharacterized protein (TIGR04255 family)
MALTTAPASSPLPEFDNPPVSEVAISVEFDPLEGWSSPHAGLYWGSIRTDYPHTEVQPPLPSQIEKFGEEFAQTPMLRVETVNPEIMRFWFLADPPTRLVQVQRDHFIINWRKVRGDERYPRYEAEMRPRFEREWTQFQDFVKEQRIGSINVQQCEITYVNDIPRGEGWDSASDSLSLFSPWWGSGSDSFLPVPETEVVGGSFRIPDDRGRLHFVTQHVRRQIDQREVIQLRLTARGRPDSSDDSSVLRWMDLGREWIVRGFTDLTTPRAHALWKRKR